ncbi:MAG: hypothetical protein KBT11_09505 [Treponema sp.]|nr:hypothetical protein [Candidatus Treponema equifaecale]
MFRNKKSIFAALVMLLTGMFAFADLPEEIIKKQVDMVNTELEANKVPDAYNRVNTLLKTFNDTTQFPGNVTYIASSTYSKYLDYIDSNKQYAVAEEVENNLKIYSGIVNANLQSKIVKIKAKASAAKEAQSVAREKAMMDTLQSSSETTAKAIQEQSESTAKAIQEQSEKFAEQSEKTTSAIQSMAEITEKNAEMQTSALHSIGKWIGWVLLGIAILALLIFLIFMFMASTSRHQTAQFDATLKLVAGMQQQNNQLLLGGVTDFSGMGVQGLKYAGSSRWGVDALPAPEMNDEEKAELKQLVVDCEKLGSEIDALTGRKNNSKNVSELVYKLAMRLGLNQNSAMAYFCASMVYDAGFKAIPEELLEAETLTDEQRAELKNHVGKYEEFLGFVPRKYWKIFEEAALYHHENMDGSGYPEGLKGDKIPQIARLIRVAESYSSLISRRNYKEILDKESAIEELSSKPQLYDVDVVKVLDAIV